MDRNLTSANSTLVITAAGLYPTPISIEGYSVDRAFEAGNVETGETQMGVDGHLSAGWVPAVNKFDIFLQANSKSVDVFENIDAAETAQRTKIRIDGVIAIPSTGKQYTLEKGYLTNVSRVPNSARVLQPRNWSIVFEKIQASNI